MRRNILGLVLGFVVGWIATPTVLEAAPIVYVMQAVQSYVIDAKLAACGDATGLTIAQAEAMKIRVAYDAPAAPAPLTFIDSTVKCVAGTSAPFCTVQASWPLASQTVGRHRVVVEGANVDPVDGTVSTYATLLDYQVDLRNAVASPQPWSFGRLIKLIIGALLAFFGHSSGK